MSIYEKVSLYIMDKKVINEEQFRKLVIEEAKKFISEGETPAEKVAVSKESKRKISFDKVESLINEMESMNKSISSLSIDLDKSSTDEVIEESTKKPNRDLDVIEHNKKKNVLHVNEGEKDKWNRMLNYNVPSDDQR